MCSARQSRHILYTYIENSRIEGQGTGSLHSPILQIYVHKQLGYNCTDEGLSVKATTVWCNRWPRT